MKPIITIILAVFSAIFTSGYGHISADSLQVYFDLSQASFNSSLGDNAASMDSFIERVRIASADNDLDNITIYGYASPEGPLALNYRLSEKRCNTIADYIVEKTGIPRYMIKVKPQGIAWTRLKQLIDDTLGVPNRDKIIQIIDNQDINPLVGGVKSRTELLKEIDGGKTYAWLLENLFPELRYTVAIALYLHSDNILESTEANFTSENDRYIGVVDSDDVIDPGDSVDTDTNTNNGISHSETAVRDIPYHIFALKTNLLYYAALMPNLELEWRFSDRWSALLEGNMAWWKNGKRNKIYEVLLIDTELRRWINPRRPWHGFYAGAFVGGGIYDLENGGTGHRGEGVMVGLSAGYMWPISRTLSFEAGIGAGYLYARDKEYEPIDGHHVYQRTKNIHYFGPLKLKFSLVWRFLDKNKSKKRVWVK